MKTQTPARLTFRGRPLFSQQVALPPLAVALALGALTATSEQDRFARVDFIHRLNTVGGAAPADPGSFVGEEARVPYTAE